MSEFDIILDNSRQNLKEVPPKILEMYNLKMLYLQENSLKKLPGNFFLKLPLLTWLDLRNNQLTKIPESVAHHQHLENLLLSDNDIRQLPNELGLVPNLKVLQVANNPLEYPSTYIITLGTRAICLYLKTQHDKDLVTMQAEIIKESKEVKLTEEEKEPEAQIKVITSKNKELMVGEPANAAMIVKSLSKEKCNDKIIHSISKDNVSNKVLIKSYYDESPDPPDEDKDYNVMTHGALKQDWMHKIRTLLEEQEIILQQERNLQTLNSWRQKKVAEPSRSAEVKTEPPYGTDPEYNSILSREDLTKQIDKLIERNKNQPKQENIQKLINDLISQLREIESTYGGIKSPRSEIEAAGHEIMKIMEVHKKLLKLQQMNNKLGQ